jgi:hypothetical protein
MTTKHQQPAPRFAICVNTDDPDLLTPRMVYQVLPDVSAAKSDYIRVIDNEGEDYLYPAKYFVLVDFPQPVKRALLRTRVPVIRGLFTGRGRLASTSRKSL